MWSTQLAHHSAEISTPAFQSAFSSSTDTPFSNSTMGATSGHYSHMLRYLTGSPYNNSHITSASPVVPDLPITDSHACQYSPGSRHHPSGRYPNQTDLRTSSCNSPAVSSPVNYTFRQGAQESHSRDTSFIQIFKPSPNASPTEQQEYSTSCQLGGNIEINSFGSDLEDPQLGSGNYECINDAAHMTEKLCDYSQSSLQSRLPLQRNGDNKTNMFAYANDISNDSPAFQREDLRREGSHPIIDTSPTSAASVSPTSTHPGANQIIKSDIVPTFEIYPGPYNFQFTVPNPSHLDEVNEEDKAKGLNYKFSKDESSVPLLFAKPGHQWPLSYSCEQDPPVNSFIRITPVFKDPDVSQEVILRCPNHVSLAGSEESSIERYSIIQVTQSSAIYVQDKTTNRYCVILPYQKPDEGSWKSTVNCKFTCFSSCQNISRRECYLIITLEHQTLSGKFDIFGRQTLHFRSCACPSRDWSSRKKRSKLGAKSKRAKVSKSIPETDSPHPSTTSNVLTESKSTDSLPPSQCFLNNNQPYALRVIPLSNPALVATIDNVIAGMLRMTAISDDHITHKVAELRQLESKLLEANMLSRSQPSALQDYQSHSIPSTQILPMCSAPPMLQHHSTAVQQLSALPSQSHISRSYLNTAPYSFFSSGDPSTNTTCHTRSDSGSRFDLNQSRYDLGEQCTALTDRSAPFSLNNSSGLSILPTSTPGQLHNFINQQNLYSDRCINPNFVDGHDEVDGYQVSATNLHHINSLNSCPEKYVYDLNSQPFKTKRNQNQSTRGKRPAKQPDYPMTGNDTSDAPSFSGPSDESNIDLNTEK